MKIRTKTLQAGPAGIIPAGTVLDLPEAQAMELVDGGYAEPVEEPQKPPAMPVPQHAPRRRAVSQPAQRRERAVDE